MLNNLRVDVKKLANPKRAATNKWFFKTGIGEYGEGDQFAGLSAPQCREIAQTYKDLDQSDTEKLLTSEVHEERLISLFILVNKFQKSSDKDKKEIYNFYLSHAKLINNWDLVDASADKIVGRYLLDKDRSLLYNLAKSDNLWERRISIIATYQFIKDKKEFEDTFKLAEILMKDKHDLIQKAVGWMLREVGKRASENGLVEFLTKHTQEMPRTMLRYAIERFPEQTRKKYLSVKQIAK